MSQGNKNSSDKINLLTTIQFPLYIIIKLDKF